MDRDCPPSSRKFQVGSKGQTSGDGRLFGFVDLACLPTDRVPRRKAQCDGDGRFHARVAPGSLLGRFVMPTPSVRAKLEFGRLKLNIALDVRSWPGCGSSRSGPTPHWNPRFECGCTL